jgi:hypothetical protein
VHRITVRRTLRVMRTRSRRTHHEVALGSAALGGGRRTTPIRIPTAGSPAGRRCSLRCRSSRRGSGAR